MTLELAGDLGGGKTTFVKGLAKGLGITKTIVSPTFTIHRSYDCPAGGTLEHFDLYRLDEDAVVIPEVAESSRDPQAIVAVEWAQRYERVLPADRIIATFHFVDENRRAITLTATGPSGSVAIQGLADDSDFAHR